MNTLQVLEWDGFVYINQVLQGDHTIQGLKISQEGWVLAKDKFKIFIFPNSFGISPIE